MQFPKNDEWHLRSSVTNLLGSLIFTLHIICRDAVAIAQFWAWLENEIQKGVTLTEVEAADKLLDFRSQQDGFIDTSFETISGICSVALVKTKNLSISKPNWYRRLLMSAHKTEVWYVWLLKWWGNKHVFLHMIGCKVELSIDVKCSRSAECYFSMYKILFMMGL